MPALKLGSVDAAGAAAFPRLRANAPGRAVLDLQAALRALGYLVPRPDGVFGENTQRALRRFQAEAGLAPDGVAGPRTLAALAARRRRRDPAAASGRLYEYLRAQIEGLGGRFDAATRRLNLLGIRGFWHGQKVADGFNRYNDSIYALWVDETGEPRAEAFDASCDPGLQKAGTAPPGGVAHLLEGQYQFQRGLHAGRYRALRQCAPVRIKRFFDDDPLRVRPTLDEGWFGINIHAAGKTDFVNDWSAGCQVIAGGRDGAAWTRFDALVYRDADPSQQRIPYTLTRSAGLTDWPEV